MFTAIANRIKAVRVEDFEQRVYRKHHQYIFVAVTLMTEEWPPSQDTLDAPVKLTAQKFNIQESEVRRIYRERGGQFAL